MNIAWALAKTFLGDYWKQIAGVIALAVIVFAIDQHGANRVQSRWDKEKAQVATAKEAFDAQDKTARKASEVQFKKDMENAKSKAGRDAVAKYVRDRGLLSVCSKLSSGGSANNSSIGTDDSTHQSGTCQSIEEFANACGQDAMKVMRWQEWATDKGFKIEPPAF